MKRKKKNTKMEIENYKKYHIPGCQNFFRRPKNCIYISAANSLVHEITKTIIAHQLRKEGKMIITESVPNDRPNRRIDLVDLSEPYPLGEIEIETNKNEYKCGSDTFYVEENNEGWTIKKRGL